MTDAVRSAWSPESPLSPTWGDAGTVGAWRAGYPDQESRGNIRPCVFLHNKCPSTRQSHLERAIRLSSARAERLRLYQRGHDESSTDSLSDGPWVSMHLNEAFLPRLRTTQGFLNSLSLVKHYIKHNNNSRPAPPPLPPILPLSLSNFLLWHFSSWSTSPKTPFICFLWRTHLHLLKRLTSHPGLLLLSVKQQRVVSRHS